MAMPTCRRLRGRLSLCNSRTRLLQLRPGRTERSIREHRPSGSVRSRLLPVPNRMRRRYSSPPPPVGDFSVSVSPASLSVVEGTPSPAVTVAVAGQNGFTGSVTMALAGLPEGATSSPAPPFSVAAGASQQMTFSIPLTVPSALTRLLSGEAAAACRTMPS